MNTYLPSNTIQFIHLIAAWSVLFILLLIPENTFAGGLVQCGVSRDCSICDIVILARDVINFVLQLLAGIGVLSVVLGGVYMVLSAGNPGMYQQGIQIINYAVIGLVMAAASFLLFGFALTALGFQSSNLGNVITFQEGQFFSIQCDTTTDFSDRGWPDPIVFPPGPGGGGGQPGGGSGGSVNTGIDNIACLEDTQITGELAGVMRAISYYEGTSTRQGYYTIQGYEYVPESTTRHPARIVDRSDAYGRYQMLSTTWPGWAERANVPRNSDESFNISPANQDRAVARFLTDNNIDTCQTFADSGNNQNRPTPYDKACQWTSIPGCRTQANANTDAKPDFAAFCRELASDPKCP